MGPETKQTPIHPILAKILDTEHLPSLPAVAVRVLELIRQKEVSIKEIAETISQDPVLSAKILKVVNSPLFRMPNNISSLPQAMVVLGLRTLKVMVLSFSLVGELANLRDENFDHELFWRRSVTTAVSSSLLAERCDPRVQDEAFAAGLLADLGILAANQCARSDYQPVIKRYHVRYRRLRACNSESLMLKCPPCSSEGGNCRTAWSWRHGTTMTTAFLPLMTTVISSRGWCGLRP